MTGSIRCYFSFRSPYAWLAFHRLHVLAATGGPAVDFVPLIPPRGFLDDMDPRKRRYIAEDVRRIAGAYGLDLQWPDPFDTEWLRPHAAFLHAVDAGKGMPFGSAVFRARFCEGRDVGNAQVLRDVAAASGLEPGVIAAAADSRALRARIIGGMRTMQDDGRLRSAISRLPGPCLLGQRSAGMAAARRGGRARPIRPGPASGPAGAPVLRTAPFAAWPLDGPCTPE